MILEIKNLKFKYPSSLRLVLDIPQFSLAKGEKVFLYGPSGCGKTTFLETLAGVIVPDEGEIEVAGTQMNRLSVTERDTFRANHVGYIFQSFNLIPYLSVLENITLPLYLSSQKRKQVSQAEELEETKKLCSKLGLTYLLEKKVTELSVGQQQRVAAARAVIGRPELIFADEPTSSLDYDHREKFINLLFDVCKQYQISVLFVSHDKTLQKLFDRAVSLPEINKASMMFQELDEASTT
ncbi:MAG: ABC transporter ATP-binding protein [Bdellovibrionaceae bacterium]|nr:ABC transporter ATP-binding protein [Pseudobdellovibrionaceae bacterium]